MDSLLDIRGVKIMARFISVCLCMVTMIAIFWRCNVMPMVFFNMGSIVFYLLSFALIQRGALASYIYLVYVEVVAHMTSAILLTGWDSDFQVASWA